MTEANGISTVRERIGMVPDQLTQQLRNPVPDLPPEILQRGVVATGVGSSEAAARYLVSLLQQIGVPASFLPLSAFYGPVRVSKSPAPWLAVFSQGLAPNARIALARRGSFAGTLLFTSSTAEGQRRAGKEDRADLLDQLRSEGGIFLLHPMQNEYEILPRFVGPVCAMLEACRLVEALVPGSIGTENLNALPERMRTSRIPEAEAMDWAQDLQAGVRFFFTNSTSQYAQNLSCKVLESLFVEAPPIGDAFTYAHGPFQVDRANSRPNWLFTSVEPNEQDLVSRLTPLFHRAGTLREQLRPVSPLSIFIYEAFLNQLILHALSTSSVDLVDWPGKGEDGDGYSLHQPGPY